MPDHVFSKCAAAHAHARRAGRLRRHGHAGAGYPGAVQPRNGFSYLLRLDGRSISTVDGKLAPGVRPLIRRLGRLEDRMLLRGE